MPETIFFVDQNPEEGGHRNVYVKRDLILPCLIQSRKGGSIQQQGILFLKHEDQLRASSQDLHAGRTPGKPNPIRVAVKRGGLSYYAHVDREDVLPE